VATFVNDMHGHANWDDTVDQVYLFISIGYRSYDKWYMTSLGFHPKVSAIN
jgi:hypothetical protein